MKPRFNVVGAAVVKGGKVLALRRSDGNESVIHKFEFVGGKIEEGETPQEALKRECMEELSLEIEVGERLSTVEYEYSDYSVVLSVYCAKPLSDYKVKIHEEEKWVSYNELDAKEWAPADREFLRILKKGFIKSHKADSWMDFAEISHIADCVMHQTFDENSPDGQVDYVIDKFLTPDAIKNNIDEKEYTYNIINLNGEAAGFYAYCPAKYFDPSMSEGVFLSKLYLMDFARGKRISTKVLHSLRRPIYLTVKRDNTKAISVYKHYGFKIVKSVTNDIGQGYMIDDFIMVLNK